MVHNLPMCSRQVIFCHSMSSSLGNETCYFAKNLIFENFQSLAPAAEDSLLEDHTDFCPFYSPSIYIYFFYIYFLCVLWDGSIWAASVSYPYLLLCCGPDMPHVPSWKLLLTFSVIYVKNYQPEPIWYLMGCHMDPSNSSIEFLPASPISDGAFLS